MATASLTQQQIRALGDEALQRVVKMKRPEEWHLQVFLNSIEQQLARKYPQYRKTNWARRVREEVEKTPAFQAALSLVRM